MKNQERKETTKTEIGKADFEELINNFADSEEIISYYNSDKEALKSFCMETYGLNFRLTYNKLIAKAKIDLRKRLLKIANGEEQGLTKNQLTAIIWLSKAYLKLRENTPVGDSQSVDKSNADFVKIPLRKSLDDFDFSEPIEDTDKDF